jgi:hypothetical protein
MSLVVKNFFYYYLKCSDLGGTPCIYVYIYMDLYVQINYWQVDLQILAYTFGYRLPAESYAFFRIQPRIASVEDTRQRRHLQLVALPNPNRARKSHNVHAERDKEHYLQRYNDDHDCKINTQLKATFPQCYQNSLEQCRGRRPSSNHLADPDLISSFGRCLVKYYPQTRDLTTATVSKVSSANRIVDFEDDRQCTDFVRGFFSRCHRLIPSCRQLQGDEDLAVLVLGCLFANYSELMLPLFNSKLRRDAYTYDGSYHQK